MKARDLLNKLHDEPFQAFRVRLSNNTTIDVIDPNTVVVGPSSAIMPLETLLDSSGYHVVSRWRTVALAHIVEFVDIDPPKSRAKRRAS
jgi:CBS-domain-containing membrane protein